MQTRLRGWLGDVELLATVPLLLVCMTGYAHRLEYFSTKAWVERKCASNTIPQDARIFIGGYLKSQEDFARVVRFHKGVTLREIIDQTPVKGKVAYVLLFRGDSASVNDFMRVGRSENPHREIKASDLVWVTDFLAGVEP